MKCLQGSGVYKSVVVAYVCCARFQVLGVGF